MCRRRSWSGNVALLSLDHREGVTEGATASTRRKVQVHPGKHLFQRTAYLVLTNNGDSKTTRKTLGGTSEPYPLLIARIRHTRSSYQPPQNSTDSSTTSPEACSKTYCSSHTATTSYPATSCLPHVHQEAQSYPHIICPPSISNLRRDALWIRMAGGRTSREGFGGNCKKLEEMWWSGHCRRRE